MTVEATALSRVFLGGPKNTVYREIAAGTQPHADTLSRPAAHYPTLVLVQARCPRQRMMPIEAFDLANVKRACTLATFGCHAPM